MANASLQEAWIRRLRSGKAKLDENSLRVRGAVDFSYDGQYIITGSDDHTARVWSAKNSAKWAGLRLALAGYILCGGNRGFFGEQCRRAECASSGNRPHTGQEA